MSIRLGWVVLYLLFIAAIMTRETYPQKVRSSFYDDYGNVKFTEQTVRYLAGTPHSKMVLISIVDPVINKGCMALTIKPSTLMQTCWELSEIKK